jgi:hypothetical protein
MLDLYSCHEERSYKMKQQNKHISTCISQQAHLNKHISTRISVSSQRSVLNPKQSYDIAKSPVFRIKLLFRSDVYIAFYLLGVWPEARGSRLLPLEVVQYGNEMHRRALSRRILWNW